MPTLLNDDTYPAVSAFFDSMVAGLPPHALLKFSDQAQFLLPVEEAYSIANQIASSLPVIERYTNRSASRYCMPSIVILTLHEFKLQWLANHFNTTLDEITKFCEYTPYDARQRQYHLDFTAPPPDHAFIQADEDLRIMSGD